MLNDHGHLWVFNVGAPGAIPDALEEDHHGQAKAGLMVCHKQAVFIKFSNFLRKFNTYSILFSNRLLGNGEQTEPKTIREKRQFTVSIHVYKSNNFKDMFSIHNGEF